jgi:hypothetical protein
MRELPPRLSSMLNIVLLIASFLEKWIGSLFFVLFRSCIVFYTYFEQKSGIEEESGSNKEVGGWFRQMCGRWVPQQKTNPSSHT